MHQKWFLLGKTWITSGTPIGLETLMRQYMTPQIPTRSKCGSAFCTTKRTFSSVTSKMYCQRDKFMYSVDRIRFLFPLCIILHKCTADLIMLLPFRLPLVENEQEHWAHLYCFGFAWAFLTWSVRRNEENAVNKIIFAFFTKDIKCVSYRVS